LLADRDLRSLTLNGFNILVILDGISPDFDMPFPFLQARIALTRCCDAAAFAAIS